MRISKQMYLPVRMLAKSGASTAANTTPVSVMATVATNLMTYAAYPLSPEHHEDACCTVYGDV